MGYKQGVTATIVQLFFAWRVKALTNNMWMVGIITITALASICTSWSNYQKATGLTSRL